MPFLVVPPGKILVATGVGLTRLHLNGTIDPGFGPARFPEMMYGPHALAIQSSAKVVALHQSQGWPPNIHLFRFGTDGTRDAQFAPMIADAHPMAMAIQADDQILVSAYRPDGINGQRREGAFLRLRPDGSVDPTFTPEVRYAVVPEPQVVNRIFVQSDGKIVIGGWFTHVNGAERAQIARLNPDGSLDSSFAPVMSVDKVLALGPQGEIYVASGNQVLRLWPDGSDDSTFVHHHDGHSWGLELSLGFDGAIVLAGGFKQVNGEPRYGMARLIPAPAWRHFGISHVNSRFTGRLDCPPNRPYRIEATADFKHWDTLAVGISTTNSIPFSDPASTLLGRRFYRVVSE
jgi:uncharacterized delta-60 repeat protein